VIGSPRLPLNQTPELTSKSIELHFFPYVVVVEEMEELLRSKSSDNANLYESLALLKKSRPIFELNFDTV
jgi:hypothetical protein